MLESRVGNCRGQIEAAIAEKGSKEKAFMDDKVYKAKEEIRDIEGLLPEIQVQLLRAEYSVYSTLCSYFQSRVRDFCHLY